MARKSITDYNMLPLRFALQRDALDQYQVAVLEPVWHEIVDDVLAELRRANARDDDVFFTYRPAATVLRAITHTLMQSFERHFNERAQRYEWKSLVALIDGGAPLPDREVIKVIENTSIYNWAEERLRKIIPGRADRVLAGLKERLEDLCMPEWTMQSLGALWDDERYTLRYQTIPALLCHYLHGRESGHANYQLRWRLLYDAKGSTHLISSLQLPIKDDAENGPFAFQISFWLQHQAGFRGREDFRLHVAPSCRRYATKTTRVSDGRDVTVNFESPHLLLSDRSPVNAQVALICTKERGAGGHWNWRDSVAPILDQLHVAGLCSPDDILKNPAAYHHRPDSQDAYFVVFRNGMKPKNNTPPGLSPADRALLAEFVLDQAGVFLKEEAPLKPSSFKVPNGPKTRSLIGQPPNNLFGHAIINAAAKARAKAEGKAVDSHIEATCYEAETRRHRLDGVPMHLLVLTLGSQAKETKDWAERAAHELFQNDASRQDWPEGITSSHHEIVPDFALPLDTGGRVPWQNGYRDHMRTQWVTRRDEISEWLGGVIAEQSASQRIPAGAKVMALIELPKLDEIKKGKTPVLREQHIKGCWRAACVLQNVGSQMLFPLKSVQSGNEKDHDSDAGRVCNGVADLLVRQAGVLYGTVAELARESRVELPDQMVQGLSIIGLYRQRFMKDFWRKGRNDAHYHLAVALRPDGRVEVKLAGAGNAWMPYHEASIRLGEIFMRSVNGKGLDFSEQAGEFAWNILQEASGSPTLVILTATDWRRGAWESLQNPRIERDRVTLKVGWEPKQAQVSDLPGVNIVRLRLRGNQAEIPDYVLAAGCDLKSRGELRLVTTSCVVPDPHVPPKFADSTFLSLCRRPETAKNVKPNQIKHEQVWKAARQPAAVEVLPFFCQPDCSAFGLAALTHALRDACPWWGHQDATVLPLPLHLGVKLATDMYWVVAGLDPTLQFMQPDNPDIVYQPSLFDQVDTEE